MLGESSQVSLDRQLTDLFHLQNHCRMINKARASVPTAQTKNPIRFFATTKTGVDGGLWCLCAAGFCSLNPSLKKRFGAAQWYETFWGILVSVETQCWTFFCTRRIRCECACWVVQNKTSKRKKLMVTSGRDVCARLLTALCCVLGVICVALFGCRRKAAVWCLYFWRLGFSWSWTAIQNKKERNVENFHLWVLLPAVLLSLRQELSSTVRREKWSHTESI